MKYSMVVVIEAPEESRHVLISDGKCSRCKQLVPLASAFYHECPERIIPKGKLAKKRRVRP
jgi:hypothetical protein